MEKYTVPEFGTLTGIKVVCSATSVAGPLVGSLMADHGADVIWLESSVGPSMERNNPEGCQIAQDRRNMRSMALNIPTEQGKKILLELLRDTDILVESSKGGQWKKWGLTDEVLWQANPKLTIVHLSGFGQTGDPAYIGRASFDPIGQAFAGLMYMNYQPGSVPAPAYPVVGDYYLGFMGVFAALAGYISAQRTGRGESVDVSQYESILRCNPLSAMLDWNLPEGHPRRFQPGNLNASAAGYNAYKCADGEYVYMLIISRGVMERVFPVLGLEYGSAELPKKAVYRIYDPEGKILEKAVVDYCLAHTAQEVETALLAVGAPVMRMMKFSDIPGNSHVIARESLTTCQNSRGEDIVCCNVMPKMKNNPGRVWRRAPGWGEDNKEILSELGFGEDDIAQLYEQHILSE